MFGDDGRCATDCLLCEAERIAVAVMLNEIELYLRQLETEAAERLRGEGLG